MAFNKETATRVEFLYRELLEKGFRGTLTFDPITAKLTQNMWDQDAFHVTVIYHGDGRLLDPAKLNRISSLMINRAAELGVEHTIIESYIDSREYAGLVACVEEAMEQVRTGARWQELLNIARYSLGRQDLPTGTELNLAVDRCYYAVYHALCHSNAQALAGRLRKERPGDWSRVYMGMDENSITPRFQHYRPQGSQPVNDFSAAFAILQEHRDRAMERLSTSYLPSEVVRLIQRAESAITALAALGTDERRSLAINLLVEKVRFRGRHTKTTQGPSSRHPASS